MGRKKKSMTTEVEHTRSSQEQFTSLLKEMQEESQKHIVLKHLKEHGSLTQKEAIELYEIYRLASRISELRRMGLEIQTIMVDNLRNSGRHAKYILEKE